jgi:hypothetical protein
MPGWNTGPPDEHASERRQSLRGFVRLQIGIAQRQIGLVAQIQQFGADRIEGADCREYRIASGRRPARTSATPRLKRA